MDKAELQALADCGRAVNDLFLAYRVAGQAFDAAVENEADDAVLEQHLDHIGALVQQADALTIPSPAAPLQRVFAAMLRSRQSYCQSVKVQHPLVRRLSNALDDVSYGKRTWREFIPEARGILLALLN